MGGHTNGAHAGAAAAVRNAEGLVQVQVTHIGPEGSWRGQTDLGIHVRPIHVNLATGFMDPLADILHRHFEHTMGAGIGDHQSGQVCTVMCDLLPDIHDVDIALQIARHRNHRHSRHHRRSGIGPMGAAGNEAYIPVPFSPTAVPGSDDEQSGVFALRTRIRLQRNTRKSGARSQPRFQFFEQLLVTTGLRQRRKRMNGAKLRPTDREHLRRCVELHGAGPQRDHAVAERQVLGFQAPEISEHLGLTAVLLEDRMGQEGAGTLRQHRSARGQVFQGERQRLPPMKGSENLQHLL